MSWKPRTIGLVGGGAAVMLALAYMSFRDDPVPVDLHYVARGPMQVTINADGVTRVRDIFEVASPISGTALRSPVAVGDRVVGGETVVAVVQPMTPSLLDSRSQAQAEAAVNEAEAALHVARTDLARAQNDLVLAQSQFTRTQTLVERDVASLTRLEDAAQRLDVANAGVEAAQARIEMANSTLAREQSMLRVPSAPAGSDASCCMELRAPAGGVVLSVASESERPVVTGAPLVSIGDPAELELVADLLSTDAVRITPGARAMVDRWGGRTLLDAELDRISPSARTKVSALGIEEQRVDAVFNITSPLADRQALGDGFAVFVRIIEWEDDNALTVPLSAVFKRGDVWTLFVVVDETVAEQAVTLGMRNSQFAQVLDGLVEGDAVIMHPNDAISAGQRIVLRSALSD